MQQDRIPAGLCQCGCGGKTPLRPHTSPRKGWVKGQPAPYIHGHNRRRPKPWREEDRGFATPCWIWQQYINRKGYGRATRPGATSSIPAHVFVYEQMVGPVPAGLQLDHLCSVRSCVNPEHLDPVTNAENSRRSRNAKITQGLADRIRAEHATGGISQRALAKRHGISQQNVSRIVRGHSWTTVD